VFWDIKKIKEINKLSFFFIITKIPMATPGNYWWRHLLYCGISVCIQQGLPPTLAEPLQVSTTTVVKESF
jgi:hypothetical protein